MGRLPERAIHGARAYVCDTVCRMDKVPPRVLHFSAFHCNKVVEFKKYLHGKSDAGSRLMFKFRSGTHGLNE